MNKNSKRNSNPLKIKNQNYHYCEQNKNSGGKDRIKLKNVLSQDQKLIRIVKRTKKNFGNKNLLKAKRHSLKFSKNKKGKTTIAPISKALHYYQNSSPKNFMRPKLIQEPIIEKKNQVNISFGE